MTASGMTRTLLMAALPAPYHRYDSLDLLRGIAVLGILLCNIWAFALPYAAYDNPAAYGDLTGLNYWAWWFPAVFAQEKFITLFSLLFGAGLGLFREHLLNQGVPALRTHYRRMFGLFVIGVLHAYLLWFGDILAVYAVCGMLLYPLLRVRTSLLLLIALALLLLEFSLLWSITREMRALTDAEMMVAVKHWLPEAALSADEVAIYRGGWLTQMQHRVPEAWAGEWATLLFYGPRLCGLMIFGVVLYRSGAFLGQWSARCYGWIALSTLLLGFAMVGHGVQQFAESGFAFSSSLLMGNYWNAVGSLLVAAGYAAAIMLWSQRPQCAGWLRLALIRTGRMAFSNYLLTSLICTTLFYGHGLAWFGRIDRVGLLIICFLVWLVLIAVSQYWMQRHPHGPFEWLWRWLSYGVRPSWHLPVPATHAEATRG